MATTASPIEQKTNATGVPVNAQNLTAQQMSAYAAQKAQDEAGIRKEAEIQSAVAARPKGTVYDPSSGTYKDPYSKTTYIGSATGKLDASGREIMHDTPGEPFGGQRFQENPTSAIVPKGVTATNSMGNAIPGISPGITPAELERKGFGTLSSDSARAEQQAEAAAGTAVQGDAAKFYQGLLDRLDSRAKEDQDMLQRQKESAERGLASAQQQETATQKAMEVRLGRADTLYGTSEMQMLAQKQRAEIADSNLKYDNLMLQSRRALEDGQISLAKEMRAAAMEEQKMAMDKSRYNLEVQKYQRDTADATFKEMAMAGFVPTDDYLETIDRTNGWDIGTSRIKFAAQENSMKIDEYKKNLENAKTELEVNKLRQELETNVYDQMGKIEDLKKKHKVGEAFQIGDNTYYGTDESTIEIGKTDGVARMLVTDPVTGETSVKQLGQLGTADPGQIETVYMNGVPVLKNKKTGQRVVASLPGQGGDMGLEKICEDGTRGGQCGYSMHSLTTDYPYGINTIAQRKAAVTIPAGTVVPPGTIVFQNTGKVGHTAMVTWTGTDPETGKTIYKLTESNMVPPNKELWSNGRTLDADDPSILGYREVTLKPEVAAALGIRDNDSSGAASGMQEEAAVESTPGGLKVKSPSPYIAGTQTESQYQASMQKENMARAEADNLMSGIYQKTTEIPSDVRGRAIQIARENGYIPEGEGIKTEIGSFYDFAKDKEKEMMAQGATMAPDSKSMKLEYESMQQAMKAFDAAIKNQAAGITPQRFKVFQQNVTDALKSGDMWAAQDRLMTGAFRGEQVKQRDQFFGTQNIIRNLDNIKTALDAFQEAGGKTGWLQGGTESLMAKVGKTNDPRLISIANQIQTAINDYRYSVTGAAFTESEAELYTKMFPSISNDKARNDAVIDGLKQGFISKREGIMRSTLGNEAADVMTKEIDVIDRETGEEVTIPKIMFDSSIYKIK